MRYEASAYVVRGRTAQTLLHSAFEHLHLNTDVLKLRTQNCLFSAAMNLPTERQLSQLEDNAQKKKTERRHGACNPCKKSKTKVSGSSTESGRPEADVLQCDGARPCGACRSEKRKSRACEYSEKAQGIAAAREEGEAKRRDRDSRSVASDGSDQYTDQAQPQDVLECPAQSSTTGTKPLALMNRPVLLCGVIEEVYPPIPSSEDVIDHGNYSS